MKAYDPDKFIKVQEQDYETALLELDSCDPRRVMGYPDDLKLLHDAVCGNSAGGTGLSGGVGSISLWEEGLEDAFVHKKRFTIYSYSGVTAFESLKQVAQMFF